MKTQTAALALILCVLISARPQPSFSRSRSRQAPPPPHIRQWQREQEQRRQQFQRRHEELVRIREEYESEAYQEALGVDAEQWMKIKPLVDRINELRVSPFLRFSVYGFSAGGGAGAVGGAGSARSGSGGSMRYGSGSGSGSHAPGRGGRYVPSAGASTGGGGYRYTQSGGSSSGGNVMAGGSGGGYAGGGGGYGFSGGGAGGGRERPVKKRVGEVNLGWMWRRPSDGKRPEDVTEGDRICESLLDAIQAEDPDPQATRARIEELRLIREQKRAELRQVRQELRALVTPEQEAKLILMGYLE